MQCSVYSGHCTGGGGGEGLYVNFGTYASKRQNIALADAVDRVQLACQEEWKMCRKEKWIEQCNTNVMYIHVCHVLYSVVVMFTCTLVRSHPDSRRCWVWNLNHCNEQQDTGLGVATRCMLGGETRMGLSLSPERGHEGCIRKVLPEDRCSSMYSNYR